MHHRSSFQKNLEREPGLTHLLETAMRKSEDYKTLMACRNESVTFAAEVFSWNGRDPHEGFKQSRLRGDFHSFRM
jgi:hypothetical protein